MDGKQQLSSGKTGIAQHRVAPVVATAAALLLLSGGLWGTGITSAASATGGQQKSGIQMPDAQFFQDVPPSNPFYDFVQNIALAGIAGGYACGGVGEPCGPSSLPYYRPNSNVTRGQMAKFVDNGRNLPGIQMDGGTMVTPFLLFSQATGGQNFYSITNSNNQHGLYALSNASHTSIVEATDQNASTNNIGVVGLMYGNTDFGVSGIAHGTNSAGVTAYTNGSTSYASYSTSANYRAAYAQSTDTNNNWASLYVDPGHGGKAATLNGDTEIDGVLTVNSCVGCFGPDEVMQNVGDTSIEPGEIVEVVGTGPTVVGSAPVLQVRKSASAYDSAVVGVAGQALYVPSADTRAEYDRQQAAIKDANAQRDAILAGEGTSQEKAAALDQISFPTATIDDSAGSVHVDASAADITAGSYGTLATQGTMPAVKVSAANGSIHAGDLLVSSNTPGTAMKADLAKLVPGTVIGKALGSVETGTGTIAVLITLK